MIDKYATPLKPYFGFASYDIAKYKCLYKGFYSFYDWDIEVDGKKLVTPGHEGLWSTMVMNWSCNKIAHKALCFPATINNGCFELMWTDDEDMLKFKNLM